MFAFIINHITTKQLEKILKKEIKLGEQYEIPSGGFTLYSSDASQSSFVNMEGPKYFGPYFVPEIHVDGFYHGYFTSDYRQKFALRAEDLEFYGTGLIIFRMIFMGLFYAIKNGLVEAKHELDSEVKNDHN